MDKLDPEEVEILEAFEAGKAVRVKDKDALVQHHKEYAAHHSQRQSPQPRGSNAGDA